MARSSAFMLSVLSIGLGVSLFYYFNFRLTSYMQPLLDACGLAGPPKGTPRPYYKLGIGPIDAINCLVTPFFLDCVAMPAGRFWVLQTLELATAVVAVMALEECRSSARGAVRSAFLVLVLSQLLGISVALPALWLPCYLLLSQPKVHGAFLPAGKVPAIALQAALAPATTLLLTYATRLPERHQPLAIAAFNLGSPLLALLWTLAPGGARAGNAAAARALRGIAGACFLLHAWSVADLALSFDLDPAPAQRALYKSIVKSSVDQSPAHFMFLDFAGVLISATIFTVSEGGPSETAGMLGMAVLAGPGAAFAAACAKREERLGRAAAPAAPAPAGASTSARGVGAKEE